MHFDAFVVWQITRRKRDRNAAIRLPVENTTDKNLQNKGPNWNCWSYNNCYRTVKFVTSPALIKEVPQDWHARKFTLLRLRPQQTKSIFPLTPSWAQGREFGGDKVTWETVRAAHRTQQQEKKKGSTSGVCSRACGQAQFLHWLLLWAASTSRVS